MNCWLLAFILSLIFNKTKDSTKRNQHPSNAITLLMGMDVCMKMCFIYPEGKHAPLDFIIIQRIEEKKKNVCKFHLFALPAENDWLECVRF